MAARKPKADVAVNDRVPQTDPEFLSSAMGFGIGWAVAELLDGRQVRRPGDEEGSYVSLEWKDSETKKLPHVYRHRVSQHLAPYDEPYFAGQDDLLATDWQAAQ